MMRPRRPALQEHLLPDSYRVDQHLLVASYTMPVDRADLIAALRPLESHGEPGANVLRHMVAELRLLELLDRPYQWSTMNFHLQVPWFNLHCVWAPDGASVTAVHHRTPGRLGETVIHADGAPVWVHWVTEVRASPDHYTLEARVPHDRTFTATLTMVVSRDKVLPEEWQPDEIIG